MGKKNKKTQKGKEQKKAPDKSEEEKKAVMKAPAEDSDSDYLGEDDVEDLAYYNYYY